MTERRQKIDSDSSQLPIRQNRTDTKEGFLEKPSLRSRGLNAPDAFSSRDYSHNINSFNEKEKQEMKLEQTKSGVVFRKITAQDTLVQVEVKIGDQMKQVKTGQEYLSQALRTVAIEMRDMVIDLNKLGKVLAKTEFEETSYFS